MTFAIGHVQGGTNAGCKRPSVTRTWMHFCRRELTRDEIADQEERGEFFGRWLRYPRTLSTYSCPDCGARRDAA